MVEKEEVVEKVEVVEKEEVVEKMEEYWVYYWQNCKQMQRLAKQVLRNHNHQMILTNRITSNRPDRSE